MRNTTALLTHHEDLKRLPGPVISAQKLDPSRARALLREPFEHARDGVPLESMQLIVCRRPGVPVKQDGSHEARFLAPGTWQVPVTGTTI